MILVQDTVQIYPGPILAGVPMSTVFAFVENTQVKARINYADLTYKELAYTTQYTVTGAGLSVGSLSLVTGTTVAEGDNLIIYLDIPIQQPTTYAPVTRFPSSLIEKQLDNLTLIAQALKESFLRAIVFPLGINYNLELPRLSAGKSFKANATADGFINTLYDPDEQITLATAQAGIATTQAGIATTQAEIATTQAGIATSKATEASNYAIVAADYAGIQVTGLTLDKDDWNLVSGLYEYDLAHTNITANSSVDVIPDNTDIDIVRAALILPLTLSSAGSVKIYANNEPTDDIGITINIKAVL